MKHLRMFLSALMVAGIAVFFFAAYAWWQATAPPDVELVQGQIINDGGANLQVSSTVELTGLEKLSHYGVPSLFSIFGIVTGVLLWKEIRRQRNSDFRYKA